MTKKPNISELADLRPFWRQHPEIFASDVLGQRLTPNQKKILKAIMSNNKVSVKSANAVGKTHILAIVIVWFFYTHLSDIPDEDCIVVFTAPIFAQIKTGLYARVKEFIGIGSQILSKKYGLEINLFPREPSEDKKSAEFWYNNTSYILGMSTDNVNAIAGKHAKYVLVIFDEAQGIKDDVYSGFQGILTSGIAKEILIGNTTLPNGCNGRFYESFQDESIYEKISITSFETPNFTVTDITVDDYFKEDNDPTNWRAKLDKFCGTNYFTHKRAKTLGIWENQIKEKLPFPRLANPLGVYDILSKAGFNLDDYEVRTRVLAQFPDGAGSSTYPLTWIQNSKDKYNDLSLFVPGKKCLGIDFGRGVGKDKSAFCVVDGNKSVYLKEFELDTRGILDKVDEIYGECPFDCIKIEKNGEGIVLARLLREKGYKVYEIDVGSSPGYGKTYDMELNKKTEDYKKRYSLKRDEIWWYLRVRLQPEKSPEDEPLFLLPPDPELEKQMRASTYRLLPTNNKIKVSDKDELRQRLKRSPDKLDSLLIAMAEVLEGDNYNYNYDDLFLFRLPSGNEYY